MAGRTEVVAEIGGDARSTHTSVRDAIDAVTAAVAAIVKVGELAPAAAIGRGDEADLVDDLVRVAHPGQVLLTDAAALEADMTGSPAALLPLGPQRLKSGGLHRVTQVVHPDLRIAFPPLRTVDRVLHNVRLGGSRFIGRRSESARLADVLEVPGVVTVTGVGGVGKSRLAEQAVLPIAERWRDGVWRIDLDAVRDADLVGAVLRDLEVADNQGDADLDRLLSHLEPRDLLLVLDGCEGSAGHVADLVVAVRRTCPTVTILATSREPLGVCDESVVVVGPMDDQGAIELFADRAAQARPTFDLSVHRDTVAQICRRLDNLPLAIELAAARTRAMNVDAILSGLDDRFRLLTGGATRAPARHATLLASIEWSYSLLDERERVALRRLAVFTGGWTLEAAEHVVGAPPLETVDVLDLLTSLVDKSLVTVDADGRHRLLESVAQFALDRLVEADEAGPARRLHLEHFAADIARHAAQIELSASLDALSAVERDEANVRAALDWAVATDDRQARTMAVDLTAYWLLRGYYRDAATVLTRWPDDHRVLAALGQVRLLSMDAATAFGMMDAAAALEAAVDAGDVRTQARAQAHLGFVESYLGMPTGAERLAAARVSARESSDHWALLWALIGDLWTSALARDDHEGAVASLAEIAALGASVNNGLLMVITDLGTGLRATRVTGDLADAVRRLRRALEQARTIGEPIMEMFSVCALAEALILVGDRATARLELEHSRERLRRSARGRAQVVGVALSALADAEGDDERATAEIESALPAIRAVGAADLVASALVVAARHDPAAADEALALARSIRNPRLEADALERRGEHVEALVVRWDAGLRPAVAASLDEVVRTAVRRRRPRDAAVVLGACAAIRSGSGWRRTPRADAALGSVLDDLESTLGRDFSAAWEEGAALDLAAAVRLATRSRSGGSVGEAGWSGLTATEQAVVDLVVAGLTNPDVAQRLHMSRATVKTHLIHIYAKLGIGSRVELATLHAARHGSQPPG